MYVSTKNLNYMYIHKYMITYLFHIVDNCHLYYTQRFTHEYTLYKIGIYMYYIHTHIHVHVYTSHITLFLYHAHEKMMMEPDGTVYITLYLHIVVQILPKLQKDASCKLYTITFSTINYL